MQDVKTNVGYSYETEKAVDLSKRYAAYGKKVKDLLVKADEKAEERKEGTVNE